MSRILDDARRLSTAFGLAMAAAAGIGTGGAAFVLGIVSLLAVLAGIRIRFASTLAVLLAGAAVMLTNGPPLVAGFAGLSAACYLVLRHNEVGMPGPRPASSPALLAALGLTCVAVAASSLPLDLPWLPLAAPLPVFAIFMLAIWPFRAQARPLRIATPSAPRPRPAA